MTGDLDRSNWLAELAARIRSEHEAVGSAARRALDHAVAAGQMLIEAKAAVPHGQWLPWLRKHCKVPPRTATHYMRLAKRLPKSAMVADLSVTKALELLSQHEQIELIKQIGRRRSASKGCWLVVISACADCGVGTFTLGEWYMVHNTTREAAWVGRLKPWHAVPGQQILCIGCLEKRLGRTLSPDDFGDVPVNDLTGGNRISDRLRNRFQRGRQP